MSTTLALEARGGQFHETVGCRDDLYVTAELVRQDFR